MLKWSTKKLGEIAWFFGPSGSGKNTIVKNILYNPKFEFCLRD